MSPHLHTSPRHPSSVPSSALSAPGASEGGAMTESASGQTIMPSIATHTVTTNVPFPTAVETNRTSGMMAQTIEESSESSMEELDISRLVLQGALVIVTT